MTGGILSPSARKEWIEMIEQYKRTVIICPSPSARKEWIEIKMHAGNYGTAARLLPQGRSGLKYAKEYIGGRKYRLLPQGRSGLKYVFII